MGVPPQAKVAIIGEGIDCLWAFLADVRIVAEVPHDYDNNAHLGDANVFWSAPPEQQQEVLTAFRRRVPIDGTGYYYHSLQEAPNSSVASASHP